jgi:hypothetical protein
MLGFSRAVLAAALLNCAVPVALAQSDTHWLTDPKSQCALFDSNAEAGDSVSWSGDCADGLATGRGTAAFSRDGAPFESFTADFAKGVAQDGPVVARWGNGWSYDGIDAHGQFNGAGVLINDQHDRFEGNWIDGKMNGPGVLTRADGERYEGAWKNDLPNGKGVLKLADGTTLEGNFTDGKFDAASAAKSVPDVKTANEAPSASKSAPNPFAGISGKTLVGIDGSRIALTLIDGGIEREITETGGTPKKTTFTFMNDRMGTVVEDGGSVANVTGFFRLTDTGVEVRYADGRSEILSSNDDGGVLMTLEASGDASCRNWYPDGHAFSDADKKAALAAYASKLGLQPASRGSCPAASAPSVHATAAPHAERHTEAKPSAAHAASFTTPGRLGSLQTVAVKNSVVHAIDADAPVIAGPVLVSDMPPPGPNAHDASHCLKVESDGHDWGFHNACDFAVQFAYCLMHGAESPTACEGEGHATGGVTGSVAGGGFGALSPDQSLAEKAVDHDFRWIACAGGAGEVAAHLTQADPVAGRCESRVTASVH